MKGEMKMKILIICILVFLWIHALSKWVVYYASTRGLLYHIGVTFGEDKIPNEKQMKEIQSYALNRIAKSFTKN